MNESLKTFLIVLAVILIPGGTIVGGYFAYKHFKKEKSNEDNTGDENADNTPVTGSSSTQNDNTYPNTEFPLKKNPNKKSDLVKKLQEKLNDRITGLVPPAVPYYNNTPITELKEDGYYGDKTAAVVKYIFPKTTGDEVTEEMYNQLTTNYKF